MDKALDEKLAALRETGIEIEKLNQSIQEKMAKIEAINRTAGRMSDMKQVQTEAEQQREALEKEIEAEKKKVEELKNSIQK